MRYSDRLVLSRVAGAPGSTNAATGAYTPPSATLYYDGPADVQEQRSRIRGTSGEPTGWEPAIVYLPKWRAKVLTLVKADDVAQATLGNGLTRTGKIDTIRWLDDALVIRWTA